ncbi:DUF4192 domain-containing protein [Nakamurella leprariae]|uniref:DUF4192 domain-containing protein n=1 Tax=Nakamurella leprariae TaxID=2803911 RepID=A0A938YDC8_9ACTN|nr:DUF4192 domain-containing protein [Nakamurella leprariae]MBM9465785.1 DUF4192 domain-containing protein [Nakamurella leprariae]
MTDDRPPAAQTRPAVPSPDPSGGSRVRLSGVVGLLAAVPATLGFHPSDSLVMVCLTATGELGPVARVDLPVGPSGGVPYQRLASFAAQHADSVVLLSYRTRAAIPRALPRLAGALRQAGVPPRDLWAVHGGAAHRVDPVRGVRDPSAAPVPLPGRDDPQVLTMQALTAFSGRAILDSRRELCRTIAPPDRERLTAFSQALSRTPRRLPDLSGIGTAPDRRSPTDRRPGPVDVALRQVERTGDVDAPAAAAVVVAMQEHRGRDAVISRAIREPDRPWAAMLSACARWTPDRAAAQLCATLTVVAYAEGDGALAQVAVDRCLRADPSHGLGTLLLSTIQTGLPPVTVRGMLAGLDDPPSGDAVGGAHPGMPGR